MKIVRGVYLKKFVRAAGILIVLALCTLYFLPAMQQYADIPREIYLQSGASKTIDLGLPVEADIKTQGVVNIGGETLEEAAGMHSPLVIESVGSGDATIELKVLGLPVKHVDVCVSEEVMVIPGGQSIGVTLHTKGALVVGITGVETPGGEVVNPARAAGMLPGDVIISINGTVVQNADHVTRIIGETEGGLSVTADRNGRLIDFEIAPVAGADDVKRLGVWVRDSTAGVGTLTFILPDEKWFGGLGHAICDLDTGSILSVKEGEIYFSEILQVNKGESGIPGEIKGFFSSAAGNIGIIKKNTEFGIYGTLYRNVDVDEFAEPVPVARRSDITPGPATILSMIDEDGVRAFTCEIVKVNTQDNVGQKGMVIKITDEELLEKTGGIVQGMSGSPILQDGRLAGAVTHVFVNNPTKGYGLFADWMLEQIE